MQYFCHSTCLTEGNWGPEKSDWLNVTQLVNEKPGFKQKSDLLLPYLTVWKMNFKTWHFIFLMIKEKYADEDSELPFWVCWVWLTVGKTTSSFSSKRQHLSEVMVSKSPSLGEIPALSSDLWPCIPALLISFVSAVTSQLPAGLLGILL